MNRRRKGGNAPAKPPALTKPPATTPAPPAIPARVSPPLKAPSPPQNVPQPPQNVSQPPKAVPQPARPTMQAPKPSLSPPKPPVPAPAMKTAHPTAPGPSQRRVFTRADRVRVQWMDFEETWVRPHQVEVEKQLSVLIETAEKNSRVKGKALEQNRDRIINTMRREFAMAAIAEWEKRLTKAGLQAEDWSDMTAEEMFAVEQVLSWEDTDEDTGVFALSQRDSVTPTLSGKTAVESSPPMAPQQHVGARTAQTAPSPAAHSQNTKPTPQQQQSSSWASWFTRGVTVTEVPEEPAARPAASTPWGAKNAPIIEDLRTAPKATPAPQPPTQPPSRPAQLAMKAPQPPAAAAAATPATPAHGLLAYAVPVSLTMPAVDGVAASDSEFVALLDKLYVNSIRQFHQKAADHDAELARQLRKPMPASEREWTVRAHMMMMEQMARDIVERRDTLINEERRKRGFGDGGRGGDPAPMTAKPQVPQPPGAFPDEHIRVSPVPAPDPEPEELEPEREPEPDVDEVIEIPIKGKKGGKKGKKAVEVKPATNGRSTPTPAPVAAAKAAASTTKASPVVEKKPAPATSSGWGAKTAPPARSASPAPLAPINTKVTSSPAVNGRNIPAPAALGRSTPAPGPMSPWEAAQAGKLSSSSSTSSTAKGPETKPPSPPNGMWAPPMARPTNSKSPYAPSRPSRLAHVSEPESPEPPSPPPTREPTGKDYVAWFAGSSSEDEAGLSEDEDVDDEEEDEEDEDAAGPVPSSSFNGGLLASLAGASPWALFGDQQPQKERGRTASPARGRGMNATPAPAMAAAGRFGVGADPSTGNMGNMGNMGMGGEWARWTAGPSSYGAGPSAGYGAGPSSAPGAGRQWKSEEDSLEDMLTLASKTLDRAATATTQVGRGGAGVNIEEAMAMYVTAQKARDTLATPVGGRSASAWRR